MGVILWALTNALSAQPLAAPTSGTLLCYHRFGPERSKDPYQITLERFRDQLRSLKAHAGDFSISIDDGYVSGMAAADILESEGLRAIYFVYPASIGKRTYLSADQLRELEQRGHRVASHSLTHPNLIKPDKGEDAVVYQARLQKELLASKTKLEKILGHPVTDLAYPYGAYNDFVAIQAKAAGYTRAYSVSAGDLRPNDDPWRLRRRLLMGQPGIKAFMRFAATPMLAGEPSGLHEGELVWQDQLPPLVAWPGATRAFVGKKKLARQETSFVLPDTLKAGLYLLSFEAGEGVTLQRSQLLFHVAPEIWREHFTKHQGN